ncbi:citrate transporter [Bacillus sp. AFS076308]|uniref:CitMHS family transporter n=1 Tax=unclassified Bacillus (in: firmicutes) TaxID=185979 RepID=UPI000BF921E1|nr:MULTISPECIES: citrate:proton symporter [unclassified Bacillus (in: firmicutes)]PFO06601.1 citrate transporter [Bacillus sp. AFS076308]PGV52845.1 citrate transporter [Bacillus sp. AFS037270]
MLAFLGFAMIVVFMYLIMTKRLSAFNALTIVPVVFALIGGFTDLGPMMLEGLQKIAPTAIMIIFAILYFGVLIDTGFFDPLVLKILKMVGGDPLKIVLGTAVLSLVVALDGDGTITYLIVVTAFLPLYERLGMNKLILACIPALAMGVMNLTPWGGPAVQAATAVNVDIIEMLIPILPSMIAGGVWVLTVAYFLGRRERKRLGVTNINVDFNNEVAATLEIGMDSIKRPKLFWFNLVLTILVMAALVAGILPIPALFMLAFAIVMIVNYPNLQDQKDRVHAHAGNILTVVSMIFAAGVFSGIIEGTGIVKAIADVLIAVIPDALGPRLTAIVALISMPFTFFMANAPFYFGIIPIMAKTAAHFGIQPIEIGQASLLGQPFHLLSPLQGSIYVLVGLLGIDIGDHIRFSAKYALGTAVVMTIVGVLIGVLSI